MDKAIWISLLSFFIQKAMSRNGQENPHYLRRSYFNGINSIPSLPRNPVPILQPHANLQLQSTLHLSHSPKHLINSLQPFLQSSQPPPNLAHPPSPPSQQITPFVHHLLPSTPIHPPQLAQTLPDGPTPAQTLSVSGLMSPTLLPPKVPLHANLHLKVQPNIQSQGRLIPTLQSQGGLISKPHPRTQRLLAPQPLSRAELLINFHPKSLPQDLDPIFRQSIASSVQPIREQQLNNNAIVTLSPLGKVGAIPHDELPVTQPYDVPETTPSYQVPAPAPSPQAPTSLPTTAQSLSRFSLDIDHLPFHPTTVFEAVPVPTTPSSLLKTEPALENSDNVLLIFEAKPTPQSSQLIIKTGFKNINPLPLVPHPTIEPALENINPILPVPHPTAEIAFEDINSLPPVPHPIMELQPAHINPTPLESNLPIEPAFSSVQSIRESRVLKPKQPTPSNLIASTACTKKEECKNESSPICEQTFVEKDDEECSITHKHSCKSRTEISYELACFHPLEEVCRKGGNCPGGKCDIACHRVPGRRSCKKVGVKTPVLDCVDVPEKVCVNVKKKVPFEKCHEVTKKVCHKVDICT